MPDGFYFTYSRPKGFDLFKDLLNLINVKNIFHRCKSYKFVGSNNSKHMTVRRFQSNPSHSEHTLKFLSVTVICFKILDTQICFTFLTYSTNGPTRNVARSVIGLNALANRLFILNNKIPLEWLNLSYNSFKVKCKESLL